MKIGLVRAASILLLLSLAACAPDKPPVIRVGTNVWPGYEPLHLAASRGLYRGVELRMVEHTSATQVMRAFRNRTIEAAALTLDEALLLKEQDLDPRIVLVLDVSNGGDAIIGMPHVTDFKSLAGRRVAVENSAVGAYLLNRALRENGMREEQVQIVSVRHDDHLRYFRDGLVEAVVTFEPVRTHLLEQGGRVLFDSRAIPGEIVDVLVVRGEILDRHPAQVRAIVNGWFAAVDYIRERPGPAYQDMAPRLTLDAEQVGKSFENILLPTREQVAREFFAPGEQSLQSRTATLMKLMLERDMLVRPVAYKEMFGGTAALFQDAGGY